MGNIMSLEVFDGSFNILEDSSSILDALLDISETLGIKSSLKDSGNDTLKLLLINRDLHK
jgi:hypothetical protein